MYEKFAELLVKNNKTAYTVSKETGIPQSVLSDWKRGRSNPKVDKLQKGDVSVPISGTLRLYNPWSESHPIFKISGEGVCKITVNGKEVSANVGQNLLINTNLMQAYREDGALNNTAITGDYENLYLQEGLNEISVSSGFAAEVIPKWGVRL